MARITSGSHILVLVDGTESSFHAADCAIDLARAVGARLTAMAVVDRETLHQLLSVKILVDAEMGEFEAELQASARRHLAHVRDRALDRRLAIEEILATGTVEEIVPRTIQEQSVDLIAMGGYDSGRVQRDLLARQRQQIVDRAACPVLLVK
jgi:nucleotide-binding universal stress UspA family protein